MNIPKVGQKIKFVRPASVHWFKCVVEDQEKLELGQEYTVRMVEICSSATYVWLEEIECYDEDRDLPYFSLHAFEWETEK